MSSAIFYKEDLAYIHDRGFSNFSLSAAKFLIKKLKQNSVTSKKIVELGSGSGRLAQQLIKNGFNVIGVDQSPAMTKLAKQHSPKGQFYCQSIWHNDIPVADAVIAVGEVINYRHGLFPTYGNIRKLFYKVFDSLVSNGIFVFDILTEKSGSTEKRFMSMSGQDWFVSVSIKDSRWLVRRDITCFRAMGQCYRKSQEVHFAKRLSLPIVRSILEKTGFHVKVFRKYGYKQLPPSHVVIWATKKKV